MKKSSIFLSIILSIYLVVTGDPTLIPVYIILLGFSMIPRSIKKLKMQKMKMTN